MASKTCKWTSSKLASGETQYQTQCGNTLYVPHDVPDAVSAISDGMKTCPGCLQPIEQ